MDFNNNQILFGISVVDGGLHHIDDYRNDYDYYLTNDGYLVFEDHGRRKTPKILKYYHNEIVDDVKKKIYALKSYIDELPDYIDFDSDDCEIYELKFGDKIVGVDDLCYYVYDKDSLFDDDGCLYGDSEAILYSIDLIKIYNEIARTINKHKPEIRLVVVNKEWQSPRINIIDEYLYNIPFFFRLIIEIIAKGIFNVLLLYLKISKIIYNKWKSVTSRKKYKRGHNG